MAFCKIYVGDCLKILPKLQSESIDLILVDPPYGISNEVKVSRKKNLGKFRDKDIILNFGDWDKFSGTDSYWQFTKKWVDECIRILRPGGMLISWFDRDKINFLSYYLQQNGFKSKGYFAHIKSNPVPQARKVNWMNAWEEIGLWQKLGGILTFNYQLGQHPDYKIVPIVSGKERTKHPTQKPEKIVELFIKYWTNEGDTVLDPFLGSGTTMKVARDLRRNCIGIEINPEYVDICKQRIFGQQQLGTDVSYEIVEGVANV